MDKQLETTDRQSKRRGFFDRPASFDFYMNAGGRFFGGLLIGLGFGLFIGAMLIKDELIPTNSAFWAVAWLVLVFIGSNITYRAVRRSAASETERSETSRRRKRAEKWRNYYFRSLAAFRDGPRGQDGQV